MDNLAEILKMSILQTLEASKPVELIEAEVIDCNPLTIKISDKLNLSKSNLVLAKGLELEKGDKVLTIRARGGQKYYVICEVEK
ncbi:MAG: DUF2577 family protein [Lachnospirales bacterium]